MIATKKEPLVEFAERIAGLAKKVGNMGSALNTEEATKTALVLPFIAALGYDVFNPSEVVPEFAAPIGEYKDARVDYAILVEGKPILLIECKPFGAPLEAKQCNQLQLYFHGTDAPIAILTDGNRYRFFSDLEAPNRMDAKPYMEFALADMDEALIPELRKLAKGKFDRNACLSAANELKYNREFKRILAEQMESPHEDFARFFIRQAYDGKITQQVLDRFTPVLVAAMNQFINDRINERLKNAMTQQQKPEAPDPSAQEAPAEDKTASGIVTTPEEIEAWYLIKSLLVGVVDSERVTMRDAQSYCAILLDDNNRKPLCRLHFNGKQWRVGLFDGDNRDDRVNIDRLDDILPLGERIRATARQYDAATNSKNREGE